MSARDAMTRALEKLLKAAGVEVCTQERCRANPPYRWAMHPPLHERSSRMAEQGQHTAGF